MEFKTKNSGHELRMLMMSCLLLMTKKLVYGESKEEMRKRDKSTKG